MPTRNLRSILFILLLMISLSGQAKLPGESDYRLETFARSQPIGAYLKAEAGRSFLLWGKSDPKKPLYGFIRPMAQFQTSGLINSLGAGIELNPISFLSFYTMKARMMRSLKDLDNFDCDGPITCDSNNIDRNIWGVKMALKIGKVFFLTRFQWHTTNIKDNQNQFFADEQGTLIGSGTKDKMLQSILILGYDFSDDQGVALLHKRNFMKNTRQDSTMIGSLYRFKAVPMFDSKWNIFAGPGVFHTRQGSDHPIFLMLAQINPKKGLTLF